jgi:hypothetical protein
MAAMKNLGEITEIFGENIDFKITKVYILIQQSTTQKY